MSERSVDPNSDEAILADLVGPAENLLENHLAVAKTWYPHEFVPWQNTAEYDPRKPWSPDIYPLNEGVRSAIFVHLLTEDNLPGYTHTILSSAPKDHPLHDWGNRWTAEEWRHSNVIRDFVLTTGAIDPLELEDARMIQMAGGNVPQPPNVPELLAYTTVQELATQVAHRNTGYKLDKDLGGKKLMAQVAGDEGLHHEFYGGLTSAVFEFNPNTMMVAMNKQMRGFNMPGIGIPNFERHSEAIALAGIYGISEFRRSVILPTFDRLKVFEVEGLDETGERAQHKLEKWLGALTRSAGIEEEKLEKARAQLIDAS